MPLMVPPVSGAAPDTDNPAVPGVRSLLRQALAVQEQERHAVVRTLHNEIGQAVSAIKMSAHLALDEPDDTQRRQDLQEIIRIADDTVGRLRELSNRLRPPQLSGLGLEAALRGEIDQLAGTAITLSAELQPLAREPDEETALACFRTAQHMLAQVLRQAPDSRLQLRLADAGEDQFDFTLAADNDVFAHRGGTADIAWALLHERASALGGRLQLTSAAGGTRVHLHLPYRAADAAAAGPVQAVASNGGHRA